MVCSPVGEAWATNEAGQFSSSKKKTLRVGADPWCPFTCGEGQASGRGLMIDHLESVLSADGITVEFLSVPWARALVEARSGKLDGVAGAIRTEADGLLLPEATPFAQRSCFYASASDAWRYDGVTSLEQLKSLGAIHGYGYGEPLDSFLKATRKKATRVDMVSGVNALRSLAKKVSAGRNQVLVEDASVFQWNQAKGGPEFQLKSVGCLAEAPLFVALSPKTEMGQRVHSLLNRASLERQRVIQNQIRKKYQLVD
jgi:polar amino acid transport system substrate-binding protein